MKFQGSCLAKAKFEDTTLDEARLRDVDLTEATLTRTTARKVQWLNTDISGAILTEVEICGAQNWDERIADNKTRYFQVTGPDCYLYILEPNDGPPDYPG